MAALVEMLNQLGGGGIKGFGVDARVSRMCLWQAGSAQFSIVVCLEAKGPLMVALCCIAIKISAVEWKLVLFTLF